MAVIINSNHGRMLSTVGPLRKEVVRVTADGSTGSFVSLLPNPLVASVVSENGSTSQAENASISGKTVSLAGLSASRNYRVEIFQPRSGEQGPIAEGASASGLIHRWKEVGSGQVTREYAWLRGHTSGQNPSFTTRLANPQFATLYAASGPTPLTTISLSGSTATATNTATSGNFLMVVEGVPPAQTVSDPYLNNMMGASGGNIVAAYMEVEGGFKRQVVYFDGDTSGSFRTDLVNPLYVAVNRCAVQGGGMTSGTATGPTGSINADGRTIDLTNLGTGDVQRVVVEGF